jgi:putative nucleotidyltransferase with HDIG domain
MALGLGRAFQSTVARRMAMLFVVCTILPVGAFTALTLHGTLRTLEERARRVLHREARQLGQQALGRLDLLARALHVLADNDIGVTQGAGHPAAAHMDMLFSHPPEAVTFLPHDAPAVPIRGERIEIDLSPDQLHHLADWGRLLTTAVLPTGRSVLVVRASPPARAMVAAVIDEADLFGLDAELALPPDSDACVVTGSTVLECSAAAPPEIVRQVLNRAAAEDGDLTLAAARGDYLVRTWTLTLGAQYGGPAWRIVLMRPVSVVHAPTETFVRNFVLLASLLTLGIAWVTVSRVRQLLRPLDALTAATSRLARREFDTPVQVSSDDEFEHVADALNDLAAELKQQFSELEAFNLGTLSALARAIDAKSPWTAGHSERVTKLAVAIGNEMGLPAAEVDHLQRGGLVHDIGKLATPPEILDKPSRLTADEQAIIEQHPEQGARILEPIPAFRALLPIVAQHHERWDGRGYPAGLSGETIARTARVLAVADVYDALRSDRPYRTGLDHAAVVEVIVSGAGRHFDPEAVDAFLAVAPRANTIAGYVPTAGESRGSSPKPGEIPAVERD